MKKVFTILATAVAMLAFNACERSEIDGIVDNSKTSFVFTSEKPALLNEDGTKTGWNGSSVQWLKGDNIRMAFKVDDVWQSSGKEGDDGTIRIYASKALTEDTQIADFTVPTDFEGTRTGNKFEFFGLYPSKAVSGTAAKNAPVLTVSIPAEQTPKAGTFDSTADLMVGSAEVLTGMPTEAIPMMWNRVVALADITLKGLAITDGENPKTVTFTAQEGADLVGSHSLDLIEGTVSNPKGVNNVITINASALEIVDGNLEVWLGMLPATVTSLSVVVETDKATYTRDITGINLAFKQNKRNLLGIDMSKAVREEKEESPILTVTVAEFNAAAVSETQKYQLTGTVNGPINETYGNFDLTDETGTVYVYGLTATDLGYGATNDKSYATLEIEEGDKVTLIGYRGEHNGKVEVVYAYFVSKETLTTPLIIVDKKEFEVAGEGGEFVIRPTVRNIDGDIMAKTDADWIDISYYGSDEVDFEVAANTGEARTATIVLSYEGAEDVTVTVNQLAASSNDGSTPEKAYTASEAYAVAAGLASDAETSEHYYIKGVISKIANNGKYAESGTYGNATFYIKDDATGTGNEFECYRVLYFNNEKYTSGTDIAVGDEVIVYATIKNFKGNTMETGSGHLYSLNGKTSDDVIKYTITVNAPSNGTVIASAQEATEGTEITLSVAPAAGYELDALTVVTENGGNVTITDNKFTMPAANVTVSATFKEAEQSGTDVINYAFVGISGNSYTDWSGKEGNSGAVYAGNSAGSNNSVQIRSKNNNSGIVTTKSGGKVQKIVVTWNSNTVEGRTLNIYGKSSAYSSAADLYNTNSQGTLLGTIVNGTSTELTVTGDYEYIGLRSAENAMYLDKIEITWE